MGLIGENIFKIESGIVAGWYENVKNTNPLLVSPYLPELVGHDPTEIVLGKHSGSPSIDHWLEKYHVSLNEEQKNELLNKIKLKAYQKCGLLDENDFSGLLKEYL